MYPDDNSNSTLFENVDYFQFSAAQFRILLINNHIVCTSELKVLLVVYFTFHVHFNLD